MKFNLSPLLLSFAINATLIPLDAHAQQEQQRFDQDVRPILSNHCWS